jgi:hypothetical protein
MDRNDEFRRRDNRRFVGMEVFEITPVILGGSPVDPRNKVLLTREQHIEAVRYWNHIVRDIRKSQTL